MKGRLGKTVSAVLMCWLFMAPASAECQRTFVVAVSGLWRDPDPERVESGVDKLWLDAIARKGGYCFSSAVPETVIARRLALLKSGDVDLLPGASKTADRVEYAWFTQPYRNEAVRLYVLRIDEARYRHVTSFSSLRTLPRWLAIRDSWLGPDYSAARSELLQAEQVFEFSTYRQGLTMLRNRRGELLLAPDTFGQYLLREGVTDVISLPDAIHVEPVHFMLSKASVSKVELAQFEHALGLVIAQGGPSP